MTPATLSVRATEKEWPALAMWYGMLLAGDADAAAEYATMMAERFPAGSVARHGWRSLGLYAVRVMLANGMRPRRRK